MKLNLPISEQLAGCRNILIAGMGGGFDVFCGLPLYFALKEQGFNVHLANYSFADITPVPAKVRLSPTLVGVEADLAGRYIYFPELYLSRWFAREQGENATIWCCQKTGAMPLLMNYRLLVQHLEIDALLVVDGGVDSLLHGDETQLGTLVEDTISLIAANEVSGVRVKLLTCVGFGAERDLAYGQVLENIATLTKAGAFQGVCSLTPQMPAAQLYEQAVLAVQPELYQDASVINSSIISAVRGQFGDYHLTTKTLGSILNITPLMPLYWFFDLAAVADHNILYTQLKTSHEFADAFRTMMEVEQYIQRRPARRIQWT